MKKIKLLLFTIILFLIICPLKIYAFSEQWLIKERSYDDRYCFMENTTAFYSTILSPKINSIKFRQDDDYYYFDYDIDYISNDIKKSSYVNSNSGTDSIFVTQLKDTWPSFYHTWCCTYSGDYICTNMQRVFGEIAYGSYKFTYNIQKQQDYDNHYKLTRDYYYVNNQINKILIPISGLNTDHYYNTPERLHEYDHGRRIPKVNGLVMGTANVTSDSTSLSDDYWQYNYKGTIKIIKNEFMNYRYLTFLATDALQNMRYEEKRSSEYEGHWDKFDLRGYSIDLNEYRTCEHDWKLVNIGDKINHELVCSNCGWNKKEKHELIYEYDGILNNECVCGYHNIINFTVNNYDENSVISKKLPSFEEIATVSIPKKIGNSFKYYNVYEKYKSDIDTYDEVFIGSKSEIDKYTNNFSIKYDPVFKPITYTFHYSNENNCGLELQNHVEDQIFTYGIGQIIRNSEYIKGKSFVGWTLDKNSNIVDFSVGKFVYNFSEIDKSEFILYPVYDDMHYYVRYTTNEGVYSNGSNSYLVKYNYYDDRLFEIPHSDDRTFRFKSYKYNDIEVANLSDIRDYPMFNGTIINLRAIITHSNGSTGGDSGGGEADTSSSYGPSGNPGSSNNSNIASGIGPGEIMDQKNEIGSSDNNAQSIESISTANMNIEKNENLLFKNNDDAFDDVISTDKDNENIENNEYDENEENRIRMTYNNENSIELSENSKKPMLIANVTEEYGGVFLSLLAVIVSAIWTFIPGKF